MSPGVPRAPGELPGSDGDPEFPIRATSPAWKRALWAPRSQPQNMEQAPEKFPGEGAWRWGSGPTRKGPDREGQSPRVAGAGRCSPAAAAARGAPRPAPQLGRPERAPVPGTLTRADADSAMAASRRPQRGRACSPSDCARVCWASPAPPRSHHQRRVDTRPRPAPAARPRRARFPLRPVRPEGEEQLRAPRSGPGG